MVIGGKRKDTSRKAWLILRTNSQRTIPLMLSLQAAEIDAWTPVERIARRKSRSREMVEFDVPMMPSWVFADARRAVDLINAASAPVKSHPAFSLFRHCDRLPLIGDSELSRLRQLEEDAAQRAARRAAKGNRRSFETGQAVSVSHAESAWRGMSGIVEAGDDKEAMVSFGGPLSVKIATWLLVPIGVNGEQIAALAA